MKFKNFFTGEVKAVNDCWIIGDVALHKIFYSLQKLKRLAILNKKQLQYLYDYYNVSCFTSNPKSVLTNTLARMVNSSVKALNDSVKIPRLILVIPDDDLLSYVFDNIENMEEYSRQAITWVTNQMKRAIEAKCDELQRKKPGAIISDEPKIIWLEMINRSNGTSDILKCVNTYNRIVNETLAEKQQHFVMDINDKLSDGQYYDQFNRLNSYGEMRFWREVDHQIELFDKEQITLKPKRRQTSNITNQEEQYNQTTRWQRNHYDDYNDYDMDDKHYYYQQPRQQENPQHHQMKLPEY